MFFCVNWFGHKNVVWLSSTFSLGDILVAAACNIQYDEVEETIADGE